MSRGQTIRVVLEVSALILGLLTFFLSGWLYYITTGIVVLILIYLFILTLIEYRKDSRKDQSDS